MPSPTTRPSVLRTPDAANYCGSSASTFEKLRLKGGGPIYSKIGRRVVYRVEDLDAWLAEHLRRSTSDKSVDRSGRSQP
jgi:predicted DNA-binding transcriptional regulator AlpA